ncbi:hypothetical protein [Methylobacterium hispanicum]|uniref:hypothetical protein n=1 Tax=Methylobacterium hispanicum TaxID=270350 RepID=UPI002F30E15D
MRATASRRACGQVAGLSCETRGRARRQPSRRFQPLTVPAGIPSSAAMAQIGRSVSRRRRAASARCSGV